MIDTIILIAIYLVSIIFAGILGYIRGYKHAVSQTEALIDAITSEYEELSGMIGGDGNARRP